MEEINGKNVFLFKGRTERTERHGHELIRRDKWDGSAPKLLTEVDAGKELPAGKLERFIMYIHKDLTWTVPLRLQIWYPVDKEKRVFRLDYEKRVQIQPSNGLYTVLSVTCSFS